jgi:hypothetical protein
MTTIVTRMTTLRSRGLRPPDFGGADGAVGGDLCVEAGCQLVAELAGLGNVFVQELQGRQVDHVVGDRRIRVGRDAVCTDHRGDVLGLGCQAPVDEGLGGIRVLGVLQQRDGTDLVGHSLGREGRRQVREALVDELLAVLSEDDARGDLAAAGHLTGGATALGILQDVAVHLAEVIQRGILVAVVEHDLRPQRLVCGAGSAGVRHRDVALESGVEQVFPRLGGVRTDLVEDVSVGAEAQRADVDSRPGAVGVFVFVGDDIRVRRDVRVEVAFRVGRDVAVGSATEPDIELRVVAGRGESSDRLATRQTYVVRSDSGLCSELCSDLLAPVFLRAADKRQFLVSRGFRGVIGSCRAG